MEKVIKLKVANQIEFRETMSFANQEYNKKLKIDLAPFHNDSSRKRMTSNSRYFIFVDGPRYSDLFVGENGKTRSRTDKEWSYFFKEYLLT